MLRIWKQTIFRCAHISSVLILSIFCIYSFLVEMNRSKTWMWFRISPLWPVQLVQSYFSSTLQEFNAILFQTKHFRSDERISNTRRLHFQSFSVQSKRLDLTIRKWIYKYVHLWISAAGPIYTWFLFSSNNFRIWSEWKFLWQNL